MEEEAKIESIGDILGSTFKDGAEYSNTSKIAIFFSFWGEIVGKKYSENSKPYSFNLGKLYVTCKNSFVLQEISMYKKDILKKANIYSKAVDLKIDDIVFSYKNWSSLFDNYDDLEEDNYDSIIDFNNYEIDKNEHDKVKKMADRVSFLNGAQKEKLVNDIKNNLIKEKLKNKE